jgi:hypothetical protein
MLDAYTIKKMLPRLILAIILVNLSWVLCTLLLHYSNVLGDSIGEILLAPFGGLDSDTVGSLSGGQQTATATLLFAGIGGVALFSSWAIVVPVLLSALFSLLVGYFTLIFRQVLIVMMILIAPIAIALWVLPGTEGWAKKWFSLYMKLLAMYPLIIALLVSGRIVSKIANTEDDLITRLIAIVAVFIPYFMIPFAFRFLGGAIATLGGFFNDRQKGLIDSSRKWAATKGAQNRDRGVNRWQLQKRSEFAGRMQDRSSKSKSGFSKFAYRRLGSTVGGYNVEASMSARQAQEAKIINDQIATGRDDEIRGLTVNRKAARAQMAQDLLNNPAATEGDLWKKEADGTIKYKSLGGAWIDEAAVDEGHRRWGNNQFAQQAALSYEMRKAMTNEQVEGISSRYQSLAKDQWGMTDRQAGGAWIGAGFENQNQHLEYKNTSWKGQRDGSKLVQEMYEKKGSYPLSQMSAHTITALREEHNDAARTISSLETMKNTSGAPLNAADQQRYDKAVEKIQMTESIARTFQTRQRMSEGQKMATEDGELIGIGNGAGHVNDEIDAFVKEVSQTKDTRQYVAGTASPNPRITGSRRPPSNTEGTFR